MVIRPDEVMIVNGRLTQVGLSFSIHESGRKVRRWAVFSCDCGQQTLMRTEGIRLGRIESCGCKRRESTTTHGDSRTRNPTYVSWRSMKYRCTSPGCPQWMQYGGRGISVCQRWIDSYQNFLADMGDRPYGTSIDRVNNEGNYEPSNCRWATNTEQHSNRSDNVIISFKEQSMCIADWSRLTGIQYWVLLQRINAGWSIERTLTTPVEKRTKLEGT